jgi:hypothetical protein
LLLVREQAQRTAQSNRPAVPALGKQRQPAEKTCTSVSEKETIYNKEGKIVSKSPLKILSALMVVIATAVVIQPVFGDHQMVFTENSSLSLSATYDGSATGVLISPVPGTPDEWFISFTLQPQLSLSLPPLQWNDPESNPANSMVNRLQNATGVPSAFFVGSEAVPATDGNGNPFPIAVDGFTYVAVGTDNSDHVAVDVTFHDFGDVAVPEPGSVALLGVGLVGLWVLRCRKAR